MCTQNSSSVHLAVCSLNNLKTYTLLIRYLVVFPPESGSLETESKDLKVTGAQDRTVHLIAAT